MHFTCNFCEQCIYEKFMHTQDHRDKQCDILNRTLLHGINEPEYPEEWTYTNDGSPTCTAFVKHDWNKDDDGNWNDPDVPVILDDPSQLCLFTAFEELDIILVHDYEFEEGNG